MAQRSGGCTAVVAAGDIPPNVLFVPPCECPDCAPERTYDQRGHDDGWLRVRGDRQRYRVEPLPLGTRGRAALG